MNLQEFAELVRKVVKFHIYQNERSSIFNESKLIFEGSSDSEWIQDLGGNYGIDTYERCEDGYNVYCVYLN